LDGTDMAWMVWPVLDGSFEDDALVVTFTLPLRLDAVVAGRTLFATFDATLPTCEAAGLGPLPHLGVGRAAWEITGRGYIASAACRRSNIGACHDLNVKSGLLSGSQLRQRSTEQRR
jgi:hypothetical protein